MEMSSNFVKSIIEEDLATGKVKRRRHALPAGTERVSAHRPRQERSA
ncbi:MAG: hypothetical protein MZU97_10695 [Bacillus subtilis]|nr:hypothetical protein [Bacillus subtilis]